jgi:hypothetical protein
MVVISDWRMNLVREEDEPTLLSRLAAEQAADATAAAAPVIGQPRPARGDNE